MDDKQKQIWDRCEDLLESCKVIDIHIVGMQSRLELGLPVDESVRIIEDEMLDLVKDKLLGLVKGVDDLRRDVDGKN